MNNNSCTNQCTYFGGNVCFTKTRAFNPKLVLSFWVFWNEFDSCKKVRIEVEVKFNALKLSSCVTKALGMKNRTEGILHGIYICAPVTSATKRHLFSVLKNYPSLALSDVLSAQKQIYRTKNISLECTDVIEWLYTGSHLTCPVWSLLWSIAIRNE